MRIDIAPPGSLTLSADDTSAPRCIGGYGYGAEPDRREAFRAEADAIADALRVLYGLWLLTNAPQTITEVAAECGFSDVSHFNRMFRRSFGCSPSAMRHGDDRDATGALVRWESLRAVARSPRGEGRPRPPPDGAPGIIPADTFLCRERRSYIV